MNQHPAARLYISTQFGRTAIMLLWVCSAVVAHASRKGPQVAPKWCLSPQVALERQDVNACCVVDAPSAVRDCDDLAAIEGQQLCCPAAHIAKALWQPNTQLEGLSATQS